jgi:hypothetical protein
MTHKRRPWGDDSPGPKVTRRPGGFLVSMLPRQTDVVNLDAYRARRVELPPGPDRCPPWCEWCFGGNQLDWRGWPS